MVTLFLLAGVASSGRAQSGTALIRRAPVVHGRVEGSLHQMAAEPFTLDSSAVVTGDLLVPGTPAIRTNGTPSFAGIADGTGGALPADYTITLGGHASLGRVRRRTDPIALAPVAAPILPSGTRMITLRPGANDPGPFASVRDLTLSGNVGPVAVPPGAYGKFTAGAGGAFTLGIAGSAEPAVYHFQQLVLHARAELRVVGPVSLNVARGFSAGGVVGAASNPAWLGLNVHSGELTVNGGGVVHGFVNAPDGAVIVEGNAQLIGGLAAGRLAINGGGLLRLPNRAPVANPGSTSVTEDGSIRIALTASDADGDPLTFAVVTAPAHGVLSGAVPNLTYVPAADYAGPDLMAFKASDGHVDSNVATLAITVTPVNDAPVADAKSLAVAEDTPGTVTLSGRDADGDALTFALVSPPAHGSLAGSSSQPTYTPALNYHGPDSFTYVASDGTLNSAPATVSITVTPVNDPPVGAAQSVAAIAGVSLPIVLTATDPDGDVLTYGIVAAPAHGTLSGAAPNLIYTAAAEFAGPDAFTFQASDGRTDSAVATVSIAVAPPPNRSPRITSSPPTSMELRADRGGPGLLRGTIRDFSKNHPNFERNMGNQSSTFVVPGLVAPFIGEDRKPIPFNLGQGGSSTDTATNFNQWYRDVPGVNFSRVLELPIAETTPGSGIYSYRSDAFFPIDGEFYGSEGLTDGQTAHNFNFTCEFHTRFVYQPGQTITFGGDDAVWVFVDDRLVIDLGGVHVSVEATAALDGLGLVPGRSYPIDIFHAEQHTGGSSFRLRTSMAFETAETYRYAVEASDPDGDSLTFALTQGPSGMTIDPSTGVISWVVDRTTAGTHAVGVQVRDPGGRMATQAYSLDVYVNAPPGIAWGSRYHAARVGEPVALAATITDDGHPAGQPIAVEWSKVSGPGSATFAPATAAATSATFSAAGIYVVQVRATDGSLAAVSTAEVRVDTVGSALSGRQATSWWPGNDSAEDIVGGRHGEPLFGAGYAAGKVGSAFTFDGLNDIVRVRANPDLDIGAAPAGFSIAFWMRCEIDTPMAAVLGWRTVTGEMGTSITMDNYLGSRRMYLNLRRTDGTDIGLGGEQMWPLNEWVHVTFTYDRTTGLARAYRDGAPKLEQLVGSLKLPTTADFWWGCLSGFNGNFFRGKIDELTIHRRALSSAEVYATYAAATVGNLPPSGNQPPVVSAGPDLAPRGLDQPVQLEGAVSDDGRPAGGIVSTQWSFVSGPASPVFANPASARTAVTLPVAGTYVLRLSASDAEAVSEDRIQIKAGQLTTRRPAELVAWWPGNDTPHDVAGGLDGLWSNAPVYDAGVVGNAFGFDGTRRVTVPASPVLNADGWAGLSLEFWVRPTTPGLGGLVFLGWKNPAGSAGVTVRLGYHWGWLLAVDLNDTSGTPHSFSFGGGIAMDAWQHLVISYDRATGFARVYRNGAQVHEAALGVFTPQTGFDLHWGNVSDESFRGRLDELSVYRRALTSEEAYALYQAGSAGKEPPGPNLAPVVDAGPDRIVRSIAESITLAGSVSDDGLPAQNGLLTRWSRLSGAGTATFGDPAQPATTVAFDQPGIHVLQLEADDGLTRTADTVELRVGPFAAAATPDGIVAWWPGNNSTLEVINGQHAQWIGPPGYTTGAAGAGFAFDGTRHMRVPASPLLNANGRPGLTLEFWVRPSGMPPSGYGASLLEWRHPNGYGGVAVWMSYRFAWNLGINFQDTAGQPHTLGIDATLVENAWQHLVIAYDRASGRMQVYRNALLVAESNLGSFTPQTAYDLRWASPGSAGFLGGFDEIAIYHRALTPGEVTAVYAAGTSGKTRPADNSAPVVNAGPDVLLASTAATAGLNGSVIDDGRPFAATTSAWSVVSAPAGATVTFADATLPATTATVSAAGTYLLRLTADDGYTQPPSDVVELRVAPGAADSPSEIAAWWPGNATPVDMVGRHDAALFSGAGYAAGRVLHGFSFDGIASFVRVDGHADLDIGASPQGLTIEFWARWDQAADRPLFAWMSETGQGEYVRAWTQAGGRAVSVWLRGTDGQDRGLYGPATLVVGQFAHLAITYDRTTGVGRLYYNGQLVDQRSLGIFRPDTGATRRLWIGSRSDARNFKGVIDEFTLYRRPLAPAEIGAVAAAAQNGKSPLDENGPPAVNAGPDLALRDAAAPVVLAGTVVDDGRPFGPPAIQWRMLAGPGTVTFANANNAATTAIFSSAGTYLLELTASDGLLTSVADTVEVRLGVALVEPPSQISAWWPGNFHPREVIAGQATLELLEGATYAAGRVLHGFSFDGIDDYARAAAHPDVDAGSSPAGFTVEFWAKPAEIRDGMILSWGATNAVGMAISQAVAGRELEVNFRDRVTSGDRILRTTGSVLAAGQWTHVAVTHDRVTGEMRTYINGVVRTAAFLGTAPVRTQYALAFGRNAWDVWLAWKGTLDEPALYRRPLAPEEIAALYAAGGDGKSPPDDNTPPVVNAGPDIALADTGASAALAGTVTDDNKPFGVPAARWRTLSGPGTVAFGDLGNATTTATFSAAGVYLLELSGSDGYVAPVSDPVEVRVGVGTAEAFPGISAWWPGDRHRREVVNSRPPIELMFGAGYGPGRVLDGFGFDGSDDLGRVTAHADVDIGGSAAGFTIEFWINPPENRDGMILSWGGTNLVGLAIYQGTAGREIEVNFRERTTSADRLLRTSGAALTAGRWTHIAVTQDRPAGEIRIYVDGVVRASGLNAGFAVRTQHGLAFGRNAWDGGFAWKGTLDEPSLYKRPLMSAEIQRIYAAGADGKSLLVVNEPPMVSAGPDVVLTDLTAVASLNGVVVDDRKPFGAPVVEWSVVEAPGTVAFADPASPRTAAAFGSAGIHVLKLTATDRFALPVSDLVEVRAGVAGTPLPADVAAWWPANGDPREVVHGNRPFELLNGAGYAAGRVSQGFLFDGTDDEARAQPHADLNVGASAPGFTLEFWVRPDRLNQGDYPLVTWHSGATQGLLVLAVSSGTQPSLFLRYVEGGANDIHPGTLLAGREGQWVHLAYTYDRPTGVVRVYRDGVLMSQQNATANRTVRTNTMLWLGRWPEAGAFKGMIDELTLYRRPLAAAEIAAIHGASANGKTAPLTNNPPLAFAGTDMSGYVGAAIPLVGFADDDGWPNPPGALAYQWSRVSGPGNVVFSAPASMATTATFDAAGTHTLRFSASDSLLAASDDIAVTVTTPASQPPTVAIVEPRNNASVPADLPVNLAATATDADGTITRIEFLRDGASLGLAAPVAGRPGVYSLAASFAASAEPIALVARATDNTGVVTNSLPVTVRVIADPGPPFAEITAPDEDSRLTAPTVVGGVAASPLLAAWRLEHRLKSAEGAPAEPWTAFAEGTGPVGTAPAEATPLVADTLGTFDPTRLLNGIYELRLTVSDTAGRIQVAGPFTVLVEGNMKIGAFTFAFEDLKVPLAGIPITLTRTYDSRDGRVGDFGPGWRLALNNIRGQKNRHLGNGWWQTPQQGSGLQFYFVEPVNERIVTVVMPDGETHRFRAGALVKNREGDPDNASFAVVVRQGRYRFYPLGDTTSTLEPLDAANQLAEIFFIGGTGNQDLTFDEFGFNPFNTSRYRLTTREGVVFIVDEALGLLEMRDTNGNTLRLNRDAQQRVTSVVSTPSPSSLHPAPSTIVVHRDATGRVDYIRDAAGKDLDYLYDGHGRLASFINREMNITQFRYELSDSPSHAHFHYLTRVIDPRGVTALRSEYDPVTGRLLKQIDADGKETVFEGGIDATGRFEKVKDRLGNETTFYYDERGNVTLKIDPLGARTSYRYHADSERLKHETDHYGNVKALAYDARGNLTVETVGASMTEDPASPATGFTTRTSYNALSAPTQIADPDGRRQTFAYDSATNNLLTHTIGDPSPISGLPSTTSYTYNPDGTLAKVTDALGNLTSHAYDYSFSSPSYPGAVKQITVLVLDPAGPAGSDPANPSDTVLRRTRALHDAQENPLAQIVTRTLAGGTTEDVVTRFEYDAENRLRATILPDGRVSEIRYTSFGKQEKTVLWKSVADYRTHDDANARITSYAYDARGNQVSVTNADGTTEWSGFDAENRRVWSEDRRGGRTFFAYDAVGRLRFTVHPDTNDGIGAAAPTTASDPRLADNPRTETQYDLIGRVRFQIDERGAKTEFTYEDNCGCFARRKEMIQHRAAGNLVTQYAYDNAGNVRFVTDPRGHAIETRYDNQGRPRFVVYPATGEHPVTQTETRYDTLGRRVEVIDQEGRSTRYRYDPLGRLVEVRQYLDPAAAPADAGFILAASDPRVAITRYTCDELGSQTAQVDALGRITRYESDSSGRRTKRTLPRDPSDPSDLSDALQYDSWGNLWKRTDFAGKTTTFSYDALNRLTSKLADPTHSSLGYSHATARIEFGYDANGARMMARTYNAAGTLLYAETTPRDERGRVDYKDTGSGGRLEYSYHTNGLPKDVVSSSPGGVNIGYRYDELNRLEHVDDASSGIPPRTTSYTYTPNGSRETMTQPNGVVHAYAYDALNRLRTLQMKAGLPMPNGPPAGTVHHSYEYKVRPSGHRWQALETLASAPATLTAPRTTAYEYDSLYRLTGESIAGDPNGVNGTVSYGLDKVGNRLARPSQLPGVTSQLDLSYNVRDWLTGDTYSPNGSTLQGGTGSLPAVASGEGWVSPVGSFTDTYDFEERLILRTRLDGSSINLVYDADGHRIRKNILTGTGAPVASTSWLVDTNNLTGYAQVFEERVATAASGSSPASTRTVVYCYGSGLISQTEEIETRNPRLETRYFGYDGGGSTRELTDPAGNVTDRFDYDAFGLLIFRSGTTPTAYLYRGEQYDADLGLYHLRARYLNPDSGRFWTMDAYEGRCADPITLQKFAYGNANPVKFRDSSGHMAGVGGLAEFAAAGAILLILVAMAIPGSPLLTGPSIQFPPIDLSPPAIVSMAGSRVLPQTDLKARERVLPRRGNCSAIIGENWRRVLAAKATRFPQADSFTWPDELEYYADQGYSEGRLPPLSAPLGLPQGSTLAVLENANYLWITNVMRRRCHIYDIGFDTGRPDYVPMFYYSELEWTRGYTFKSAVSFPGSDNLLGK